MRIFFREGAAVKEVTKQLSSYKTDLTIMNIDPADSIYIASDFPLNHFYIKMGGVINALPATMSISYWGSEGWKQAVNVNDYTDTLSISGLVEFTPDRDEAWLKESTNSSGQIIDELSTITVYDKYWTKISFDNSLSPSVEIEWIGNIFSNDDDLFSEYPVFNDSTFLDAFESGKTNWEEQHVKAAELIIQDLKRKGVIIGPEQLLDISLLRPAAICKTAEIIFNSFGSDYATQKQDARKEYDVRIDLSKFVVDTNNNAIVDSADVEFKQGWLSR